MNIESVIRAIAGSMILLSLLLTVFVHANFIWLTAFIGANLLQSAFTGTCPSIFVLKKLGVIGK